MRHGCKFVLFFLLVSKVVLGVKQLILRNFQSRGNTKNVVLI